MNKTITNFTRNYKFQAGTNLRIFRKQSETLTQIKKIWSEACHFQKTSTLDNNPDKL